MNGSAQLISSNAIPTNNTTNNNHHNSDEQYDDVGWKVQYRQLVMYKQKHGNTNVHSNPSPNYDTLREWVNSQRLQFVQRKENVSALSVKKTTCFLNMERIGLLEALQFDWDQKQEKKPKQTTNKRGAISLSLESVNANEDKNGRKKRKLSKERQKEKAKEGTGVRSVSKRADCSSASDQSSCFTAAASSSADTMASAKDKSDSFVANLSANSSSTYHDHDESTSSLSKNNQKWMTNFKKFKLYISEHGDYPFASPHGSSSSTTSPHASSSSMLGHWMNTQRVQYRLWMGGNKYCSLTSHQIDLMESIGFDWHYVTWESRFTELKHFYHNNHDLNDDDNGGDDDDCVEKLCALTPGLGNWARMQKTQCRLYREGTPTSMTPNRLRQLESIGFIPKHSQDPKALVKKKKKQHDATTTSPLEEIRTDDKEWFAQLDDLKCYKFVEGNCNVPSCYPPNMKLGGWVNDQRNNYKKWQQEKPSNMTKQRVLALEHLGFDWQQTPPKQTSQQQTQPQEQHPVNRSNVSWETRLEQLITYSDKHNHMHVPFSLNPPLSSWISRQRIEYKRHENNQPSILTLEQMEALDNIGFDWSLSPQQQQNKKHMMQYQQQQEAWSELWEELQMYKLQHGDCFVPLDQDPDNLTLGKWVKEQREQYQRIQQNDHTSKTTMNIERIDALDTLGFHWNHHSSDDDTTIMNGDDSKEDGQKEEEESTPEHKNDASNQTPQTPQTGQGTASNRTTRRSARLSSSVTTPWKGSRRSQTRNSTGIFHDDADIPECNRNDDDANVAKVNHEQEEEQECDSEKERKEEISNTPNHHRRYKHTERQEEQWHAKLMELKQYKEDNGNIHLKGKRSTPLGKWLGTQQKNYHLLQSGEEVPTMTQTRITALEDIGIDWKPKKQPAIATTWEERYEELRKYAQEHNGSTSVPMKYAPNPNLGIWVSQQRIQYKKFQENETTSTITLEQIEALDNLGFAWRPRPKSEELWDLRLDELRQYKQTHGNCLVPRHYPPNPKLASWVQSQRSKYKQSIRDGNNNSNHPEESITNRRIRALQRLEFVWTPPLKHDEVWEERLEELRKYKLKHGDTNVPRDYAPSPCLSTWVKNQRQQYKRFQESKASTMTQERIRRLENLEFAWTTERSVTTPRTDSWRIRFEELCLYKAEHGDCLVPQRYAKNARLGYWVHKQREAYKLWKESKRPGLCTELIDALDSIGFVWLTKKGNAKISWEVRFEELLSYKSIHGDCNVPKTYPDNPPLGKWVRKQRDQYQLKNRGLNASITPKRIQMLESIGFVWSFLKKENTGAISWEERYAQLKHYKETTGGFIFPERGGEHYGQLRDWVLTQRRQFRLLEEKKASSMNAERIDKLESIGFQWSVHKRAGRQVGDVIWKTKFEELVRFKMEHNHCLVPKNYPVNPPLANWVQKQRDEYRILQQQQQQQQEQGTIKSNMAQQHIDMLESIGFNWTLQDKEHYYWVYQIDNESWRTRWEELRLYKAEHGDTVVPTKYPINPQLGTWVANQRMQYKAFMAGKDSNITQKHVNALNELEFVWSHHKKYVGTWEDRMEQLKAYKLVHGHCRVPKKFKGNPLLADWAYRQRKRYRQLQEGEPSPLTSEQIEELESIGFVWNPMYVDSNVGVDWETRFQQLKAYHTEHGDCQIPKRTPNTPNLFEWVLQLRTEHRLFREGKPSSLTLERIEKMENLGFNWNPKDVEYKDWDTRFEELKEYLGGDKHAFLHKTFHDNLQLGRWVDAQRRQYTLLQEKKTTPMTPERVTALESIGFVWQPKLVSWNLRFEQLKSYNIVYGDTLVPETFSENSILGAWVHEQRKQLNLWKDGKPSSLTLERLRKLDSIGFIQKNKKGEDKHQSVDRKFVSGIYPVNAAVV